MYRRKYKILKSLRALIGCSRKSAALAIAFGIIPLTSLFAQEPEKKRDWETDGEIENVEIEIVKERQITLPKANRNFEKIPPALLNRSSRRSRTISSHLMCKRLRSTHRFVH
jgi:hypothetical protein